MENTKRLRKKLNAPEGSSRAKGDIVEKIVAVMHETLGAKIERNVFLPVKDGSHREREIDVLITSLVAGYPVRIAIECKNKKKNVGVEEIDTFIGKLVDIGIPVQHGIFVSGSGYTSGAVSRAQKAGIKTLILSNSLHDLVLSVNEALQSLVFILLNITNIEITNNVGGQASTIDLLTFCDESGKIVGSIPDLVWWKWRQGTITEELGKREIDLRLPVGWFQIIKGEKAELWGIKVTVRVTGYVINIPGKIVHHSLVDALSQKIERHQIETDFTTQSEKHVIKAFTSESELIQFLEGPGLRITVGRFRIPRIVAHNIYWPPSRKSIEKVFKIKKEYEQGLGRDPHAMSLSEIEGTDLNEAWDQIWDELPIAKALSKKNKLI